MFTSIRKWWHIIQDYRSFYVQYNDGGTTYKMRYFECVELAKIFKGKVIFDPKRRNSIYE